jgi:hypothetical protein
MIYLDDVVKRNQNTRAIGYPITHLKVVAIRAKIPIGSQEWVERAAKVVTEYKRTQRQEAA